MKRRRDSRVSSSVCVFSSLMTTSGMRGSASSPTGSALIVAVTGRSSGAGLAAADCSPTIVLHAARAAVRRSSVVPTATNLGASAARGRSGLAGRVVAAHAAVAAARQMREIVRRVGFISLSRARLKLLEGKRSGRIILKNVRPATSFAEQGRDVESLAREDEFNMFDADEDLRATSAARETARRFEPGELVACDKCLRANAPTRMNCLYCGAPLPVTERSAALRRPSLRKLEEWEQGF